MICFTRRGRHGGLPLQLGATTAQKLRVLSTLRTSAPPKIKIRVIGFHPMTSVVAKSDSSFARFRNAMEKEIVNYTGL